MPQSTYLLQGFINLMILTIFVVYLVITFTRMLHLKDIIVKCLFVMKNLITLLISVIKLLPISWLKYILIGLFILMVVLLLNILIWAICYPTLITEMFNYSIKELINK